MQVTREQRDAWSAGTRNSPFNRWLRARTTGPDGRLDLDLLSGLAAEFGVDLQRYAHLNPGQQRMNVGNRLRRLVPPSFYAADPAPASTGSSPNPAEATLIEAESANIRWPLLREATASDLLQVQAAAIEELRYRGIVRTGNAPLGDYAEHLFARALGWRLTPNSATSYDAEDDCGNRYQIKARRLRTHTASERQLGVMRGLPDQTFDFLAAVLFDRDFTVHRAAVVPHASVLDRAMHIKHVNGWRFVLDDSIWNVDGVQDMTSVLQSAAAALNDGHPTATKGKS